LARDRLPLGTWNPRENVFNLQREALASRRLGSEIECGDEAVPELTADVTSVRSDPRRVPCDESILNARLAGDVPNLFNQGVQLEMTIRRRLSWRRQWEVAARGRRRAFDFSHERFYPISGSRIARGELRHQCDRVGVVCPFGV
jgi:hypothetical protein